MARQLDRIVKLLDRELDVRKFNDVSNNGLQVENSGKITKICCGVDASMDFFEIARDKGADMIICHHGISWGDSLKRITDVNYRHVSFLLNNDIALYACHLPLDAHPVYGNNAGICRALGLKRLKRFGLYGGYQIGFEGTFPKSMSFEKFKSLVGRTISPEMRTMDFGKKVIKSVAVVSGAAADEIAEAGQKGIHVYLSGEPNLQAYNLAREYSMNAVFAGHYATEVFGVRAIAGLLSKKLNIKAEFIDLKAPY